MVAAFAVFICTALVGYEAQFGDFTYADRGTTIEITDYPEDATGDLIIPGEIVGKPVTSIGEQAFRNYTSLTSIGDWAFNGCIRPTNVTIPNNVTSIGDWASLIGHPVREASPHRPNHSRPYPNRRYIP